MWNSRTCRCLHRTWQRQSETLWWTRWLSHVFWHFCCVHALDLLKGLKNKKTNKNLYYGIPRWWILPIGHRNKNKIDLNKPKTLQECTAASPKWFAPERPHGILWWCCLRGPSSAPWAARRQHHQSIPWEHPLVRTGPCVTVITLLAACQTHAILQNSAVDASLFFSGWLYCFNVFIWPNTFSKHFF